jgi:hypothetical protein
MSAAKSLSAPLAQNPQIRLSLHRKVQINHLNHINKP